MCQQTSLVRHSTTQPVVLDIQQRYLASELSLLIILKHCQ